MLNYGRGDAIGSRSIKLLSSEMGETSVAGEYSLGWEMLRL